MDAENASLGDERRARPEEYGRAQRNSESRGFAGFGSNGFDPANGSNGATNHSDSVPDHGYTWTPAPPSTPQNQQNTGGSVALDPFATWNTPGVIGDAPAPGLMTSGGQDLDPRFATPAQDGPPLPAPPDNPRDPDGPETAALPTRSPAGGAHTHADTTDMPRIPQTGAPTAALSSSSRIPMPGAHPTDSTDPTVPASTGLPERRPQLSGVTSTPRPATDPAEPSTGPAPYPGEENYRPADSDPGTFTESSTDPGSLPSWLSSIGEEPAPQPVESGGRRRKLEPDEPAEPFNPFADQHSGAPSADTADPRDLPGTPAESDPAESASADRPKQPSFALPTRTPSAYPASAAGSDTAPEALPARRLPRSAARHAPAREPEPVSENLPNADSVAEPETPRPLETPADPEGSDAGTAREPAVPRRLPRSAARYTPERQDDRSGEPEPDSATPLRIVTSGDEDTAPPDDEPAAATAPPRLAPPPDSVPILDRLLEQEPARGIDPGDESAAPVAEILTRILESEQENGGSRHAEPTDSPDEEGPAAQRGPAAAALTLVPDEEADATQARTAQSEIRPPLETRRSRRAREAAEAAAPLTGQPEPSLTAPAASTEPEPAATRASDTASRHGRNEEGADIDIHLIMRLLTASDDLEVLAGQAETGEVSAAEVARAAREARAAVLAAVSAWYGGPAQMVKFANALLQAARES
ncbi:hypothetical protein [Nocardia sp. X0981]